MNKAFKHYQGRGVENNTPKPGNNQQIHEAKGRAILDNIKNSIKSAVTSVFWAALIVSIETIAIWWMWNYIVPEHPLTYLKTFLGVMMVRLILRTTISLNPKK